jgi:hypothetical protein
MISDITGSSDREVTPHQQRLATSADLWLRLAAAPTFAIMALLTAVRGGGMPDMLCSAALGPSPMGGMVAMYVLMSIFHCAPWLTLISSRPSGGRSFPARTSRA